MSQADNNDKRCVAQQIIHDLFEAKATGQIQILLMACTLAAKQLDPDSYRKFIEHSLTILPSAGDKPFPFECENCGHKPTPQEVLEHHGDCAKCRDTVITYTVDAAECIVRLMANNAMSDRMTYDILLARWEHRIDDLENRITRTDAHENQALGIQACVDDLNEVLKGKTDSPSTAKWTHHFKVNGIQVEGSLDVV